MKNKVLVVGLSSNPGGVEAVVGNYVDRLSGSIQFDFILHEHADFAFLHLNENKVYLLPRKRKNPIKYKRDLEYIFETNKYKSLWFNANNLANIDSLILAKKYGIQNRVLHAHNDNWLGGCYQRISSELHHKQALECSTQRWACSDAAGVWFFGKSDFRVVPNVIDVRKYVYDQYSRIKIRQKYGIDNKIVIGNVGRLCMQKNQIFLLSILRELTKWNKKYVLMLVGEGEARNSIERAIKKMHLEDYVVLTGSISGDVTPYLSAMDVFAFPSVFEGLGVAFLEAQINGLPCVISTAIPPEAIVSGNVIRLSNGAVNDWARALSSVKRIPGLLSKERISRYDITEQSKLITELFSM